MKFLGQRSNFEKKFEINDNFLKFQMAISSLLIEVSTWNKKHFHFFNDFFSSRYILFEINLFDIFGVIITIGSKVKQKIISQFLKSPMHYTRQLSCQIATCRISIRISIRLPLFYVYLYTNTKTDFQQSTTSMFIRHYWSFIMN